MQCSHLSISDVRLTDECDPTCRMCPAVQAAVMKDKPQYYINTSHRGVTLFPSLEQVGNAVFLTVQSNWRASGHTDEEFKTVSGLCMPCRAGGPAHVTTLNRVDCDDTVVVGMCMLMSALVCCKFSTTGMQHHDDAGCCTAAVVDRLWHRKGEAVHVSELRRPPDI